MSKSITKPMAHEIDLEVVVELDRYAVYNQRHIPSSVIPSLAESWAMKASEELGEYGTLSDYTVSELAKFMCYNSFYILDVLMHLKDKNKEAQNEAVA